MMRIEKYLDFNMILYDAFWLLNKVPEIKVNLSNVFKIMLIDEYQDTQIYQYAIIHDIIKANNGKTILNYVGDSNQSIYRSMGGFAMSKEDIETQAGIIVEDKIVLKGCYRSTQRIIDYYCNYQVTSYAIDSKNEERKDEAGLITHEQTVSKESVVMKIIQLIKYAKELGVPDEEICIVAPIWPFIYNLGRRLRVALPEVDFDAPGMFLLKADPFNTYFQMARLLLTIPTPRLLPYRTRWAKELQQELYIANNQSFPGDYHTVRDLLRLINSISPIEEDGTQYLKKATGELLDRLGIIPESSLTLKTHRDSFFSSMERKISQNTGIPNDTASLKKMFQRRKGVVITSCHQVKGEEYDTVIAFGVLEGRIPYKYSQDPEGDAKRMLYVISSRAKKHLHLISETGRTMFVNKKTVNLLPTQVLKQTIFSYDSNEIK